MIPSIIKNDSTSQPVRVGPVSPITPVKAIADSHQSPPNFTQGQKYQAIVETRLQNGNVRISVAGQVLQMKLPDNIQPGSKIELIFIAKEPQLKFLLQNYASLGAEKIVTSNINVSATGHLLGSLIQDILQSKPLKQLPNTTPILASPLTNSAELPALLQKAITQSGLFYESHLAQWITGRNTLKQLQQEPQSKLSIANMTTSTSLNNDKAGVHSQSLPFVQQQLSALETGHLVWRGEIWPEQLMEWNISEHSHYDNEPNTGESSFQWQMQLHLTLPKLGEVTANILFNPHDLFIRLNTDATKTAELLKKNQQPLSTAIGLAGLNINIHSVEIHSSDNS